MRDSGAAARVALERRATRSVPDSGRAVGRLADLGDLGSAHRRPDGPARSPVLAVLGIVGSSVAAKPIVLVSVAAVLFGVAPWMGRRCVSRGQWCQCPPTG